jgi:uncharacterized protein
MLYVDSSALSKRYLQEPGSPELAIKLQEAGKAKDPVLTSFLTYAEIHTVLGRKLRDGSLLPAEYHFAVTQFDSDWRTYFVLVEVSQLVLSLVPELVKRHPLKASDAVQLASAFWAAQAAGLRTQKSAQRARVFATSDKQLAAAAEYEQFEVFNPETP